MEPSLDSKSSDSEHNAQQSIDFRAQLNALPELSGGVLTSYHNLFSAFLSLLKAKAKANIKMLIAIMALIASAVFLLCGLWISLQALIVYSLISAGLSVFSAAIIVLSINVFVIYYLVNTALCLLDTSYDEFIDGFFTTK